MKPLSLFARLLGLSLSFASLSQAADAPNAGPDDRVRAALRETTLQLRTVQNDLAVAQSSQVALTEENRLLKEKLAALQKQQVTERTESDRQLASLKKQVGEQETRNESLKGAFEKASSQGDETAVALRDAQQKNAQLTAEKTAWERRAADRQRKNLALFMVGNEILSRYEEFSLGTALRAKEPFVGTMRTKLETLVQDYRDKLLDQKTDS